MDKVWVILSHEGYGEDSSIDGVYATRDAAKAALEAMPNMVVEDDFEGDLAGHPAKRIDPMDVKAYRGRWIPQRWASAKPYEVHKDV